MGNAKTKLAPTLLLVLSLSSQLIYYYNQINGIKPTFLRVFQMMSSLVTPNNIGLTDEQHIIKLVRRTGKLLKLNANLVIPIIGFIFIIISYYLKTTLSETLLYGILNAILWCFWVILVFNICLTQIFCFYIP